MSEKELEEFKEVTVPKNLNTPTKLDPFMKALLEKRGYNKIFLLDEEWQKLYSKLYSSVVLLAQTIIGGLRALPDNPI